MKIESLLLSFLFISSVVNSTLLKTKATRKIPESKKLEVRFTRTGDPAEVITNNDLISVKSNMENLKVGKEHHYAPVVHKTYDGEVVEDNDHEKQETAYDIDEVEQEEIPEEEQEEDIGFNDKGENNLFSHLSESDVLDDVPTPTGPELDQTDYNIRDMGQGMMMSAEMNINGEDGMHHEKMHVGETYHPEEGNQSAVYSHHVSGYHNDDFGDEESPPLGLKRFFGFQDGHEEDIEKEEKEWDVTDEHEEDTVEHEGDTDEESDAVEDSGGYEGAEELHTLTEDLKSALNQSKMQDPVLINPDVLQNVMGYLGELGKQEKKDEEQEEDKEEEMKESHQKSSELESRIKQLEDEIGHLTNHIEALHTTGGHEEQIKELDEQEENLETESNSLKLQKEIEDEKLLKEQIEEMQSKEIKAKKVGDKNEEIVLDDVITSLEIQDEELQTKIEKGEIEDYDSEIHELEEEKEALEKEEHNEEKLEEVEQKISDLQSQEELIVDDEHIIDEIEGHIKTDQEEIEDLKKHEGTEHEVETLEADIKKLEDEESRIESIEKAEQNGDFDTEDKELEHNIMFSNAEEVENVEELEEKKAEEDHEEGEGEDITKSYKSFSPMVMELEEIKSRTIDFFKHIPASEQKIAKGTPEETDEVNAQFDNLIELLGNLDEYENSINPSISFVHETFQKLGDKQNDVLFFYNLNKEYDEIRMMNIEITKPYEKQDAEIKAETKEFTETVEEIKREMTSVKTFNDVLKDETMQLKAINEKEEEPTQSIKTEIVTTLTPRLIELKEEILRMISETKANIRFLKEKREKVNGMIHTLKGIAEGEEVGEDGQLLSSLAHRQSGEEDKSGFKILASLILVIAGLMI